MGTMMDLGLRSADNRVWLAATDPSTAGSVRRAAVALGEEIGLPAAAISGLAIIATEATTNLARHADEGVVLLRVVRAGDAAGVGLVAIDQGPGMADVLASSVDGHSTGGTLGIGLGAITRMATDFDIYSRPGTGTVLAATVWAKPPAPTWLDGVARPLAGETACGDGYAARELDGRRQIMLCDGLGHGPLAALASEAAIAAFLEAPPGGPKEILAFLHGRIGHTRGAVVGIAEVNAARDTVRFAGIGNIAASVCGDVRRAMVSMPGIVGQQRHSVREFDYPLPPDALIIMHSDGLTERWSLADHPGLLTRTPVVVAATLLRDASRRRDDAAIVVARP
ncbi:anti-sigma regulatory factor (Ser/Thr protein kinase) [Allocatelliglobosispora scoriae]|uniref:Anti-sigma regulatory factor (Ser/Thr protein kinase) n=1 Tax=Allocatelliglobosispora scoriae TaxID=643052 RepID=A0A841C123_9ACTN|nr:ATP-binding protein [Allocatelliglobosispora scoriae]MBB5873438.1 anti-sigma regulatory factor (Ser/Thr protein kinase) [Allocatelliglobosispora scoriae]